MVKANAYGHGIREVVSYCQSEKLTSDFGVASINELCDIENLDSSDFWIFSEVDLENNKDLYNKSNIHPVISNFEDLNYLIKNYKNKELVLKFDTGMNRLGFKEQDLDQLIKILRNNNINVIKHIMTHFSSSYFKIEKNSKTMKQYELFKSIKRRLLDAKFVINESSVCNSGAIEQNLDSTETHIRPGLMLYGPRSYGIFDKNIKTDYKNISTLKSEMISCNYYESGSEIGYGNTKLKISGWIAILPIGYGDGILNYYTNAKVRCDDQIGEIFGRVNMDLCFIYFKNEPKSEEVLFWDDDLVEFSNQVKSIPYQVLTSITQRVPKVFKY